MIPRYIDLDYLSLVVFEFDEKLSDREYKMCPIENDDSSQKVYS